MNALSTIVAGRGLSKASLDELWNPDRLAHLETPPPGYLHTVDTLNSLGRALHDDWTGKEMLGASISAIYEISQQDLRFEDGMLASIDRQRLQSKLTTLSRACGLFGIERPNHEIFSEQFCRFALSAQAELIATHRAAMQRARKAVEHLQILCAQGEIGAVYRKDGALEVELQPSDWNLGDVFDRIRKCSVASTDVKSHTASPDATLFFRELDVNRLLNGEVLARESSEKWAERLGVKHVTPMLSALLDVVKAIDASEGARLAKNDVLTLLQYAGSKNKVVFNDHHANVATLFIRSEEARKGVKNAERLDLFEARKRILGSPQNGQ